MDISPPSSGRVTGYPAGVPVTIRAAGDRYPSYGLTVADSPRDGQAVVVCVTIDGGRPKVYPTSILRPGWPALSRGHQRTLARMVAAAEGDPDGIVHLHPAGTTPPRYAIGHPLPAGTRNPRAHTVPVSEVLDLYEQGRITDPADLTFRIVTLPEATS